MTDTYELPLAYRIRERTVPHDDRLLTDEWQDEVYRLAAEQCQGTVIDIGCGSGFKLRKHFKGRRIGYELTPMVAWLRQTYDGDVWRDMKDGPVKADTVVCADVIEHVEKPDELLAFIEACQPRRAYISTPNRDLVGSPLGPPQNPSHVREWSFVEFRKYLERRWTVLEHFHTNEQQGTQLAICEVSSG